MHILNYFALKSCMVSNFILLYIIHYFITRLSLNLLLTVNLISLHSKHLGSMQELNNSLMKAYMFIAFLKCPILA